MFFVIAFIFFIVRVILIMLSVFLITMKNEFSLINILFFHLFFLNLNLIDSCLLIFAIRHIFYLLLLHQLGFIFFYSENLDDFSSFVKLFQT